MCPCFRYVDIFNTSSHNFDLVLTAQVHKHAMRVFEYKWTILFIYKVLHPEFQPCHMPSQYNFTRIASNLDGIVLCISANIKIA